MLPLSYSWRNVLARKASTAVTLAGVAVSVAVFVVISATADGMSKLATTTGDPENLIVLSSGMGGAEASRLSRDVVELVVYAAGVARDPDGHPLASPELVLSRAVERPDAGPGDASRVRYSTIRGISPHGLQVHRSVRIAQGRFPRAPGEIMVGRLLPRELGGVGLGDSLRWGEREHRIVGIFAAEGQIFESEIWAHLDDLRAESQQAEASIVVARLAEPRALPAILEAIESAKRVSVDVMPEPEYYAQIQRASLTFVFLANLLGGLLGLGAIVAGMNTMYAAMSRRVREMGTLRALGFGRWSVGGSLLIESTCVGVLGGILGCGLALAFDGAALNLVNLAFELQVEPRSLARGLVLASGIGLLGGILPARAAARLEIVQALRHA